MNCLTCHELKKCVTSASLVCATCYSKQIGSTATGTAKIETDIRCVRCTEMSKCFPNKKLLSTLVNTPSNECLMCNRPRACIKEDSAICNRCLVEEQFGGYDADEVTAACLSCAENSDCFPSEEKTTDRFFSKENALDRRKDITDVASEYGVVVYNGITPKSKCPYCNKFSLNLFETSDTFRCIECFKTGSKDDLERMLKVKEATSSIKGTKEGKYEVAAIESSPVDNYIKDLLKHGIKLEKDATYTVCRQGFIAYIAYINILENLIAYIGTILDNPQKIKEAIAKVEKMKTNLGKLSESLNVSYGTYTGFSDCD